MTSKDKVELKENAFQQKYHSAYLKKKGLYLLAGIFRYTLLICLGFVILTPILRTLKDAITAQSAMGLKNSIWIPSEVSMQSFLSAWYILKFDKAIWYTILNTGILMVLQTLCAAMAAYSFARLKFRGSNLLFGLVIFTIIVPSQSIMLAQYISFKNFDIFNLFELFTGSPLNLVGSQGALYILAATGVGVKGGLYIYILRQAIRNLPVSIEEAAYVDGAGFIKTFFTIIIPSTTSSLITVGVLSFVWNYADDYFMSLLNPTDYHLPLRLMYIQRNMRWTIMDLEKMEVMPDKYILQWDSPIVQGAVASASALLVILPLLILYFFVQKKFVQGVERSGLGGE